MLAPYMSSSHLIDHLRSPMLFLARIFKAHSTFLVLVTVPLLSHPDEIQITGSTPFTSSAFGMAVKQSWLRGKVTHVRLLYIM